MRHGKQKVLVCHEASMNCLLIIHPTVNKRVKGMKNVLNLFKVALNFM